MRWIKRLLGIPLHKPQSLELTKFYAAWYEWVKKGAPDDTFIRTSGLCHNARRYAFRRDACPDIEKELCRQFRAHGMDDVYPFGEREWNYDLMNSSMHENPARLAWVRKRLGEGRALWKDKV